MAVFNKIMGVFMIIFGIFLIRWFPSSKDLQPTKLSWFGIAVGVPSVYLGIYLLLH